MKYYLTFFILLVGVSAEAQAIDELHKTTAENLAASEYYSEVTKGNPKAFSADVKEKQGEIEIKKGAASVGFDKSSHKTAVEKTGKTAVEKYIVQSNSGDTVIMDNKVKDIPAANAPKPVSDEAADDLFLQYLEKDSSAKAANEDYKNTYETEVGSKKEKDFDISDKLKAAEKEQKQADNNFEAANSVPVVKKEEKNDLTDTVLKAVTNALVGQSASGSAENGMSTNPNASARACKGYCREKGFKSCQYNNHPPAGWSKCGCI